MAVQSLHYQITANDTQLKGAIGTVQKFNSALFTSAAATQALDAQVRAFGRRTTEIGRFMTRNITLPTIVAGAVLTKFGLDFEKSMAKVGSLTDTTEKQLGSFRKEILAMSGSEVSQGPKELADALYFIRSSGIPASKTMEVLTATGKAASAGLGDVATLTDAVTSAMNAYRVANLTGARATDILMATIRVGKAEPNELAKAIGRVIPLAQSMGVSFAEVGGAIASMTQSGASAEIAVTGLRAILSTFQKALVPTQNALQGMGFRIDDVTASIREQGVLPTLITLRKEVDKFGQTGGKLDQELVKAAKLGGMDEAVALLQKRLGNTANTMIGKLFPNIRALTSFLILTAGGGKGASAAMQEVADSVGETQRALDKYKASPAGKFEFTLARLQKEATQLGVQLLPTATKLLGMVEKLASAFGKIPGPLRELIAVNAILFAAVGPLLIALGTLVRISSVWAIKKVAQDKAATASQNAVTGAVAGTARAYQGLATSAAQAAAAQRLAASQVTIGGPAFGGGRTLRGPGGRFVSPAMVAADMRSFRLMSRDVRNVRAATGQATGAISQLRGGFKTLGPAIRGAALAVRGFMAALWPLLAFEGVLLLITHWDQVADKIEKARQGLALFLGLQEEIDDPFDAAKVSDRATRGFELRMARMIRQQKDAGKSFGEAMRITKEALDPGGDFPLIMADAIRLASKHTQKELEAMKNPLGGKGKELGAVIAKNAAAEMARTIEQDKSMIKAWRDKLKEVFGVFQTDVLAAFDARTEAMLDNITVKVVALGKNFRSTFSLKGDALTPAERELAAMDKVIAKRQAQDAIEDARQALREARGKKLVEFQRGRYIFGIVQKGDVKAVKDAQRQLRDAQEGLRRSNLEARAEIERKAADKAFEAARKELRARRDLEKRHFEKELEALATRLATGKVKEKEARAELTRILKAYGVDVKQAGRDLGTAFATGLQESMAAVFRQMRRIRNAYVNLQNIKKQLDAPVPAPKKTPPRVEPRRPDRLAPSAGTPKFDQPGRAEKPTGPTDVFAPLRPSVYIHGMHVTSPAEAELTARTIARKIGGR